MRRPGTTAAGGLRASAWGPLIGLSVRGSIGRWALGERGSVAPAPLRCVQGVVGSIDHRRRSRTVPRVQSDPGGEGDIQKGATAMRDLQISDPDTNLLGPFEQYLLVHIGQQQ